MAQPTPDKPFNIRGVKGVPHPRLNILDFSTKAEYSKQWYLYLQAMSNITKHAVAGLGDSVLDLDRPLGFYQIAGIHGLPFIHWVENQQAGDRPGAYCTHGTALFLTWHRPYLLLLEQCIVDEAVKVAEKLGSDIRAEYITEAWKIRLPYWDWASNSDIPEALRHPKITISHPSPRSSTEAIHNPLYSYNFQSQEIRSRDFAIINEPDFVRFDETKRCPDAWGFSHPEIVDRQLRGPIKPNPRLPTNWGPGIYQLLTTVGTYGAFSNTGWKNRDHPDDEYPQNYQSLESFHNALHNYTGTNYSAQPMITGHMTEALVSAFDPIFWLHHANIDRLYAMWQAMYYDVEFQDESAETARLPPPPPQSQDLATTPLRPFYYTDTQERTHVWTSADVQKSQPNKWPSVYDFNYYYPEIPFHADTPTKREQLRVEVFDKVVQLYLPAATLQHWEKPPVDGSVPDHVTKATNYRLEWMVCLHVRKYIVKGNFVIFFFLGQPEAEPHKWIASPNLAGSFTTFKTDSNYCGNCLSQEEADAEMCGGVHLTNALYRKRGTSSTGAGEVAEWLRKNLHWRILKEDGTELSFRDVRLEDLTVKVMSFGMRYPKQSIFLTPTDGNGQTLLDSVSKVYSPKEHLKGTAPSGMEIFH